MNQIKESQAGESTERLNDVVRQIIQDVDGIIGLLHEIDDDVIASVSKETQGEVTEDELQRAVQDTYNMLYKMNGLNLVTIADKLGAFDMNESLDEARYGRYSHAYAILPATMALYGKRVVTPDEAISTWGEGTLYICTKMERDGRERILFVASAGGGVGLKVGDLMDTVHDQTGASKGTYEIKNIVTYENGERVKTENDFGLNVKGSLSVFK